MSRPLYFFLLFSSAVLFSCGGDNQNRNNKVNSDQQQGEHQDQQQGEQDFAHAFITQWKTDNPGHSESDQIKISTSGSGYNYTIDWGDGTSDTGVKGDITHTYASAGIYTVSISGQFPQIAFGDHENPDNESTDHEKLLSVEQWGNQHWRSMYRAFLGCNNLVINAQDSPDLSAVRDMSYMFASASKMNHDLSDWDVASVEDMTALFSGASQFNQDLRDWDVSNVKSMKQMFASAEAFNQDISAWNTSSLKDMSSMFYNAAAFNQDIGSWNTSSVEDMSLLFYIAQSFNQDLSGWQISEVKSMSLMFGRITLSTEHYDALLASWSAQPLQANVTFGAGNSQYSPELKSRRDLLIDSFNWTISDGGVVDTSATISQPLTEEQWALDMLDGENDGLYQYRYTGKGTRIYIVDTILDSTHPEISDRIAGHFQAHYNETEYYCDHGVNVASLAAGRSVGVARDADLILVRTISCELIGSDNVVQSNSSLLSALEWIIENEKNMEAGRAVVNMSIAINRYNEEGLNLIGYSLTYDTFTGFVGVNDQKMESLLHQLSELDVVLIGAAGNKSAERLKFKRDEHYPAYFHFLDEVLIVGNLSNSTTRSETSMLGEIYAPGTDVYSAAMQGSEATYKKVTGTSMASPLAAGVAAIILERYPEASAQEVIDMIYDSAVVVDDGQGRENSQFRVLSVPQQLL